MPERDWKHLRERSRVCLARYYQRVLQEISQVIATSQETPHAGCLAIYELIHDRDRDLADTFNGLRRSTALVQLASMLRHQLATPAERNRISEETQHPLLAFNL